MKANLETFYRDPALDGAIAFRNILPVGRARAMAGRRRIQSSASTRLHVTRIDGMLRVMSRSLVPEAIESYLRVISRETPVQRRLREETSHLEHAGMQIGADQGALLAILVRSLGARRAIEVGTFTGYSALAVALALPPDGKLVCCDVSEEWTSVGRRYWKDAGVADRIDLRIAPATETLAALIRDGGTGTFDFAFIDADKPNYDAYYESCLILLRPGGVIALDNMLWSGKVADPNAHDASADALRTLNAKIRDDSRVDACLLTVGDGVMLAQKRATG